MPIYEYACDTCQTTFERKQKFSDDPVRICPDCGNDVRRVLYPAGIIFKGSGFYVTDNRSSKTPSASSSSSSSNGSESSNGSSTSESSSSSKTASVAADS
jgi:putative FmdB family regulatory protein